MADCADYRACGYAVCGLGDEKAHLISKKEKMKNRRIFPKKQSSFENLKIARIADKNGDDSAGNGKNESKRKKPEAVTIRHGLLCV